MVLPPPARKAGEVRGLGFLAPAEAVPASLTVLMEVLAALMEAGPALLEALAALLEAVSGPARVRADLGGAQASP